MSRSPEDWVSYIEVIRSNNNALWMDILRIALKTSPQETKALLSQIRINDLRISEATGRIADGEN